MNQFGVRSKYSPRIGVVVECGEHGDKTQQHFKDKCDINKIARDITATGSSERLQAAQARYGDFSDIMDVGLNFDKARKAEELFQQTPVELRRRCGHSIKGLFEFISDEKNREECIKFGIFKKPETADSVGNTRIPSAEPAPQATKSGAMKKPKVQAPASDTEE